MAYFPNGTSGIDFLSRNCDFCTQWKEREGYPGEGIGCPVWDCHVLYDHSEESVGSLLDMLIQETSGGLKCHLFTPKNATDALEAAGQLRLVPVPNEEMQ